MEVELVRSTQDPELIIAQAAAISHDTSIENIDQARELISKLLNWGHFSPLEFADATFKIEGISRATHSQLIRHRMCSFMVRSQRRVNESDNEPVVPLIANDNLIKALKGAYSHSKRVYQALVKNGVPKEKARMVLPLGSRTELFMKTNFREYRHIFKLRAVNEDAQDEIRELTTIMLEMLEDIAPSVFGNLVERAHDQGGS